MYEQEIQVLKALANGVNYFTGEKCDDDCILNDVKIVRTLYNVCDHLNSSAPIPANQFEHVPAKNAECVRTSKTKFVCPPDLLDRFEYGNELSLLKIIYRIARLYPQMYAIRHADLTNALIEKGLLAKIDDKDDSYRLVPTEFGQQNGIRTIARTTKYGRHYETVVFDPNGQKLVLTIIKELY